MWASIKHRQKIAAIRLNNGHERFSCMENFSRAHVQFIDFPYGRPIEVGVHVHMRQL